MEEKKRAVLKTVGETMRQERKSAGYTQSDVADGLGVTREYVSMIENGTRTPSPQTVAKFSAMLGKESDGEKDAKRARRK